MATGRAEHAPEQGGPGASAPIRSAPPSDSSSTQAGPPPLSPRLAPGYAIPLRLLPFLVLAATFAANIAQGLFVRADSFQAYAFFNYAYGNVLAAGELPQWLPLAAYGAPAEPYLMAFLGPAQLCAIFLGALVHGTDAWALFLAATLAESALYVLGAWLLGRALFQSELAASAVACWVALTIYWSTQIFWPHRELLLVPLLLLFTLRFHRSGDLREALRAALVLVLAQVGGLVYVGPVHGLLALVFFGLLRLVDRKGGFARLKRPGLSLLPDLVLLGLAVGLFLALFADPFQGATITSPGRDGAGGASSLDVFLRYGGTAVAKVAELAVGQWISHAEFLFYLGVAGLGLALFALRRQGRGPVLALAGACGFLFLLSLGPHGLVGYAVYWLPGMDRFRHVAFLLPMVRLLLLFLAGAGLDLLLSRPERRAECLFWITLAALAVLVVKDVLLRWPNAVPEAGVALLLVARLATRRAPAPVLAACLALLVALDLGLAQQVLLRDTRAFSTAQERHDVAGVDLGQVQPAPFLPGRGASLEGFARPDLLSELAARQSENNFTLLQFAGADPCAPIFRVDYMMPGVLALLEQAAPGALLRANPDADPARSLRFARWDAALAQPWFREACGCGGGKLALEFADDTRRDAGADVQGFSANRLLARVDAGSQGATLYYADAFHPGWQALVDGRPAPVALARGAFKAVALPPGEHRVELAFFAPWREAARRALALVSALALLGLLGLARRTP